MTTKYVYLDEAGCFTFERKQSASKYFILCSVVTDDNSARASLNELRFELIKDGYEVGDYFHATTDKQVVRDRVYETILGHKFTIQAQICEKAKAQPQVRSNRARFYQYPLFYLFRHGVRPHFRDASHVHATAASLGTKKERIAFANALNDVCSQTAKLDRSVDFRPSQTDPMLQLADYCAWAIQRKWERGDERSYEIIKDRITYEYDLWKNGTKLYY